MLLSKYATRVVKHLRDFTILGSSTLWDPQMCTTRLKVWAYKRKKLISQCEQKGFHFLKPVGN